MTNNSRHLQLGTLLICAFVLLPSCSSKYQYRTMEIRKSQYLVHEEYLDAIVRIRNNFDPKLISFLKNDDLFRPIVNLNDFFVFGRYDLHNNTEVSNNAITIDYYVVYKLEDKQCWCGRTISALSSDSCYLDYWINLNDNNEVRSPDAVQFKSKSVYYEDENGFNKNFFLFAGEESYSDTYGFAKKTKKDIVSIYTNKDYSNNYYFDCDIFGCLQDSYVWDND